MIFRSLDIETVVDEAAWTRGEPAYRIVPGDPGDCEPYRLTPAQEGRGRSSLVRLPSDLVRPGEAYSPLVEVSEPFPPPQACRVVAISYVDVKFDVGHDPRYWFHRCDSWCLWCPWDAAKADEAERSLLGRFGDLMADGPEEVHLVTWNGRTFDLPVISMRSLKHGVSCGWYYKSKDVRYRYSAEGHCDLMDHMSDFGASRQMKLGDFARLCGLPGKTDMSGDKVDVLYREAAARPEVSQELAAKIKRYCQQDTLQTALGHVRTRHHMGKLSPESHDATVRTFRDSEAVRAAIDVDWDRLMLVRSEAAAVHEIVGGAP